MRQTPTAELRLDHGRAAGSGITRRATRRLLANGGGVIEFSCVGTSRDGKIAPNRSRIRGVSVKMFVDVVAAAMRCMSMKMSRSHVVAGKIF